jgi:hypothetical protein
MSYSKIFSGDIPELTYEVLKYFKNDFSTLHSCILVNRLWCRLAIPLLWENPFSILTGNHKFIEIYLLYTLNDELKTKLNEYELYDNSLSSNTLFNYPKFIKNLSTYKIVSSVDRWFGMALETAKPLDPYSRSYLKRLVNISLLKIFIDDEVKLHNLEIDNTINSDYYNAIFNNILLNDILKLILQNPNFIHNIRNLELQIISDYNNKNCMSLINLHQNLKKIVFSYTKSISFYQSLLLSKDNNYSNTLNTIIFHNINFGNINNFDEIFEKLNVLESVHIVYCHPLNIDFIRQIIKLTKPFKLKSLFLNDKFQFDESLQLLLQKSGSYLKNFGYRFGLTSNVKQQLVELITNYCKNIKFFDFYGFKSQILNLIENINYLSINVYEIYNSIENAEQSSIVLRNLGQTLPLKLEYLSLTLIINIDNFEIFLKNSQNTFIKKLLINNIEGDDILPYIKEYIMKTKRVKYLAINNSYLLDKNVDLSSFKYEVKEFQLYNIKIRKYSDLVINNTLNFIKEID